MSRVILFDVNETLLDLSALEPIFQRVFKESHFMGQWFMLLLHSSLVTTLTRAYWDFGTLAGASLDLVASRSDVSLEARDRDEILSTMRHLPPHSDVRESLERLRSAGYRLATLTNSPREVLSAQMMNSGLKDYFEQLISVDEVRAYKPAPETYHAAAKKLGAEPERVWLVAAHDWDVFGALRAGCQGAFIARQGKVYHPLYDTPEVMGPDMVEVTERIVQYEESR